MGVMPPELADPESIISDAESERATIAQDAADAYQWFADHMGQMVSRNEAIDAIADRLDCDLGHANRVVANLIDDAVDPVQQVRAKGTKWVGIIDYREYPDAGAYGYENYDDTTGRHKRLVCAKCVEEAETPSDVSTATAGTGSLPDDASYDQLLDRVTSHYASNHDAAPEDIEIGASLISGTTINSNEAWHAGNDGLDSGLNADTVQGTDVVTEIDTHKGSSQDVHGVGSNNAVASDQDITDHTSNDVHNKAQPPQDHDNDDHTVPFAVEGTTNVEAFVSGGNAGDTFIVNQDGNVTVEPASADTDVHAFGGGKHTASTLANINPKISDGQIPTGVDSLVTASDSPYLASGDNLVLVDTSTGAVTVQLASADTTQGNKVRVVDVAGSASTNNITIETESAEAIEPGGATTATISVDGAWLDLYPDGSDWYAQDNIEADTADVSDIQTTTATVGDTFTDPGGVSHTVELFEAADYTPVTDVGGETINPDSVNFAVDITDSQGNTVTDFLGKNLSLSSGVLTAVGGGVDARKNLIDLQMQVGRLNFEIGLESLGWDNGDFENYANTDGVSSTSNTAVVEGSEVDGRGYSELQSSQTSGTVTHVEFDVDVIPNEIVVADDMFAPLSSRADVTHTITDENGNSITFDRSDIDTVVDASSLTTYRLELETTITRDAPNVQTPKVDSWGVYATGDQPPGDYFDAEQVGAPARTELYVSGDPTATTDFQISSITVN